MQLTQRIRIWTILGGWLCASSGMVGAAIAAPVATQPQSGDGIPIACQMQPLHQIRNPSDRHTAIVNLFDRYISQSFTTITDETPTGLTTGQTAQILQLIAALPPQEELELKAKSLLWLAAIDQHNGDRAKAIPLLSQALAQALLLNKTKDQNPDLLRQIGQELVAVGQMELAATALSASLQAFQANPASVSPRTIEFLLALSKLSMSLGKSATAIELLDEAVPLVRSLPKDDPLHNQVGLLTMISMQYGIAGATTKADALYADSLKLATASPNATQKADQLFHVWAAIAIAVSADDLAQLPADQQTRARTEQQQKSEQVLTQLLTTLKPLKNRGDFLQNIALRWVANHQAERVIQLAKSQPDPEDRFFVLLTLVPNTSSPDNPQQINQVLPVLEQARDAAYAIQDASAKDDALIRLVAVYAEWGQRSQALQTIASIQDQDQKQTAQFQIVSSLALAGQPDQAFTLVQTLPSDPKDLERGLVPRKSLVLGQLALGYTKAGKLDQALQVIASVPPGLLRNQTLVYMADALTRAGKSQQAVTLLTQVTNVEIRYQALFDTADILLRAGDLDQALTLTQSIPPANAPKSLDANRQEILRKIATAYAETGQYGKAIKIAQALSDQSLMALVTCAQSASLKPK